MDFLLNLYVLGGQFLLTILLIFLMDTLDNRDNTSRFTLILFMVISLVPMVGSLLVGVLLIGLFSVLIGRGSEWLNEPVDWEWLKKDKS